MLTSPVWKVLATDHWPRSVSVMTKEWWRQPALRLQELFTHLSIQLNSRARLTHLFFLVHRSPRTNQCRQYYQSDVICGFETTRMYLTVSITLECSLSVTWVCTEMPRCSLFLLQVLVIAVVLSCSQTLSTSWVWQAISRMPRPSCPPCRRIYLLMPTYQPTSSLLLQGYSELRVSVCQLLN